MRSALSLFLRYYGKSKPFPGKELKDHMHFLTSEQAMADFAGLISELKQIEGAQKSAVIGTLSKQFPQPRPHIAFNTYVDLWHLCRFWRILWRHDWILVRELPRCHSDEWIRWTLVLMDDGQWSTLPAGSA